MENKITPEKLFESAREKYFKVYDFPNGTRKEDKRWIRVGVIKEMNKPVKWNFFDGERLISDEPFDKAEPFEYGFSIVNRGKLSNVLKPDGSFVFNDWYNYIYRIGEPGKYIGFTVEKYIDQLGLDRSCAFTDLSGKIVSDWFSEVYPMMSGGKYCVSMKTGKGVLEKKDAIYDTETSKIETDWYDSLSLYFGKPKVCRAKLNGRYNLIGEDCKLIFGEWSSKPIEIDKNGMCQVFTEYGVVYNGDVATGKLECVK